MKYLRSILLTNGNLVAYQETRRFLLEVGYVGTYESRFVRKLTNG